MILAKSGEPVGIRDTKYSLNKHCDSIGKGIHWKEMKEFTREETIIWKNSVPNCLNW